MFDFVQLSYMYSRNAGLRGCPPRHLTLLMEDLYETMCDHETKEWELVADQLQKLRPEPHVEYSTSDRNEDLFSSILEATRIQMDEQTRDAWNIGQVPASQYGIVHPQELPFPPATPNWPYREPRSNKEMRNDSVNGHDPISYQPLAPQDSFPSTSGRGHSTLTQGVENGCQNDGFGPPLDMLASRYPSIQVCPGILLDD
jgi:hypothetical protein